MSQKATLPACALVLLVVCLTVWTRPGAAQSQAPDTTIDALKGEKVVIFFRDLPLSGKREVIQIHGNVNAVSEHGLWLKTTARFFRSTKEEKYEGAVYVPWTSVAYTRVLR